jgi:threonine-phosphate decarboxylase
MLDDALSNYHLVIIDQSYEHYTHQSLLTAAEAVGKKKVILLHSMTKTYAVPGLRLGYLVTSKPLAKGLRQNLRPWSVSSLAIEAGKFLLQHDELICRPNLVEAQRLRSKLCQIKGISVEDTHTNFMLCHIETATAHDLKDYLASEHHILIRDCSNFEGLTPHHFRVAAQTPAENDALVEAIKTFVKRNSLTQ